MVAEILGVVKEVPVFKLLPPDAAAYQLMVPALAAATKETVPEPQRFPSVVELIVGMGLMVAVTADLDVVAQPLSVAST